jgi:hypothetical protein
MLLARSASFLALCPLHDFRLSEQPLVLVDFFDNFGLQHRFTTCKDSARPFQNGGEHAQVV